MRRTMIALKEDGFISSLFMFAVSFVMLVALPTYAEAALVHSPNQKQYTVKVCQHKNCMKQYKEGNLLETIKNLIPPESFDSFNVESSGCLSGCGKGPNVMTESSTDGEFTMFGGVDGPLVVSEMLKSRYSFDCPAMLLAACDVMAKANTFTSFAKKEKYLSSVIDTLSNNPDLATSRALVSALLLRADARSSESDVDGAVKDCREALRIDSEDGRAWRLLAESLEMVGDTLGALEAVTKWAEVESVFVTKAQREAERLRTKLSGRS